MLNTPFNVLRYKQWDFAPKDPVSIATLIAPSIMAAGGAAAFLTTTAVFLATTAITTWAVNALTPKPQNGMRGLQTNIRDAAASGEIVYGTVRKGGVITFMESAGQDNQVLRMVLVLAAHEVAGIDDIYIDDKKVTLDANGWVTSNGWNSKIKIEKMLGSPNQTANVNLDSGTSVTSTFRGRGIAYLYISLEYNQEIFTNGIPLITAVVRGMKVYNPNTGVTAHSANAAACIHNYLTNSVIGVGAPSSQIDTVSFTEAFNDCEDDILLSDINLQKRYEINGVLSTADSPKANLQKMMTACAGSLWWSQGKFKLKVGKWKEPVKTLTLNDLRSEITLSTKTPLRDSFNVVKGTFVSQSVDWIVTEYPEHRSATFITQDGGQDNVLDLELPLTTDRAMAQRIAKLTLFRAREQMSFTATFGLSALSLEVGDNVNLSLSRYGWNPKTFEVVEWVLRIDPQNGTTVDLTLKETSEASYNWNAEEKDIISNDSTLPVPGSGLTVTGLVVTYGNEIDVDGRSISNAFLDWTVAAPAFVDYYQVQYKRTGFTRWQNTASETSSVTISPLVANTLYDFRVRSVSVGGFRGPWTNLTNSTTSRDLTPPPVVDPSTWTATAAGGAIRLSFQLPVAADFSHVDIYTSGFLDISTAQLIGRSTSGKFTYEVDDGITRYFWLKSVDRSGNASAFSAVRSATPRKITKDDIDTGYRPGDNGSGPPAVGTVTATGAVRMFALNWNAVVDADFSHYDVAMNSGTNIPATVGYRTSQDFANIPIAADNATRHFWVRAVDTSGRVGSWSPMAQATTVANGGVTAANVQSVLDSAATALSMRIPKTVSTLPTSGMITNDLVLLTTDSKLYRYNGTAWTKEVDGGDLKPLSITTGKIAAAAIGADEIAAGAVVASKMAVTDLNNIILNPNLSEDSAPWDLEETGFESFTRAVFNGPGFTALTTMPAPACLATGNNGLAYRAVQRIPVKAAPGEQFRVTLDYAGGGTMADNIIKVYLYFRNAAKGHISAPHIIVPVTTTAWNKHTEAITAPTNAAELYLVLVERPSGGTGAAFATNFGVYRMNGGELVVDGGIKANHLDTVNAVITGTAQIGNGIITTAKIGNAQISSAKIEDLAVSNLKIGNEAVSATKAFSLALYGADAWYNDSTTYSTLMSYSVAFPYSTNYIFMLMSELRGMPLTSGATTNDLGYVGLKILIDGEPIIEERGWGFGAYRSKLSKVWTVSAGTHTVLVQAATKNWALDPAGFKGLENPQLYIFGASK